MYENKKRTSNHLHLHDAKTRLRNQWLRYVGNDVHRQYSNINTFADISASCSSIRTNYLVDDSNEQIFEEIENLDKMLNSIL